MDIDETRNGELVARLRRLDAASGIVAPHFDYDAMLNRHASNQVRARRRATLARGTAGALVIALVGLSAWRVEQNRSTPSPGASVATEPAVTAAVSEGRGSQPRIVRADTYLAVAAIEDHLASLDDALNDARLRDGKADVARLERTRAELLDSYTHVRYAEMVSANF
jgi:hypothetical protein